MEALGSIRILVLTAFLLGLVGLGGVPKAQAFGTCSFGAVDWSSQATFLNSIRLDCIRGVAISPADLISDGQFSTESSYYFGNSGVLADYDHISQIATCQLCRILPMNYGFMALESTPLQRASVYMNDIGKEIARARVLSKASLAHRALDEYNVDDFIGFAWVLQNVGLSIGNSSYFRNVISGLVNAAKSFNPDMKFGITLYEDQLNPAHRSSFLRGSGLPGTVTIDDYLRGKIDVIHFYLHRRENWTKLVDTVASIQARFPNAKIWIGLYNYDRRYAEGAPYERNELTLLRMALITSRTMLYSRTIEKIEFYPGRFGNSDIPNIHPTLTRMMPSMQIVIDSVL